MNIIQFAQSHPIGTILTLGGTGAFIIALINALFKDVLSRMVNFLISTIFEHKNVNDNFTIVVLSTYLNAHAKSYGLSEELYEADQRHIKTEGREKVIFTRRTNQSYRLFIYHGAPILLTPQRFTDNGDSQSYGSLRFVAGTVNWEKLLIAAGEYYDQHCSKRPAGKNFRVIRHVGENRFTERRTPKATTSDFDEPDDPLNSCLFPINYIPETVGPPAPMNSMDNVALTPDMKTIVRDVRFWLKHRDWYSDRDITWRRGYLLYGQPGNGKTTIVRAIAEDLDLVVHTFDLSSMDNTDFLNAWNSTKDDIPRIVLFEDFDTVFHGRNNVCNGSDLTFDTILNAIDGIEREDGLLLFVTTNLIEAVDPALGIPDPNGMSSRPGRIDKVAEILPPDYTGRFKIALRILKDETLASEVARIGEHDSGAQVQERAIATALNALWNNADEP